MGGVKGSTRGEVGWTSSDGESEEEGMLCILTVAGPPANRGAAGKVLWAPGRGEAVGRTYGLRVGESACACVQKGVGGVSCVSGSF